MSRTSDADEVDFDKNAGAAGALGVSRSVTKGTAVVAVILFVTLRTNTEELFGAGAGFRSLLFALSFLLLSSFLLLVDDVLADI